VKILTFEWICKVKKSGGFVRYLKNFDIWDPEFSHQFSIILPSELKSGWLLQKKTQSTVKPGHYTDRM
jgi:hypothetical protein